MLLMCITSFTFALITMRDLTLEPLWPYCVYQQVVTVFFCSHGMVKESIVCEGEFNNLDCSVRGRY